MNELAIDSKPEFETQDMEVDGFRHPSRRAQFGRLVSVRQNASISDLSVWDRPTFSYSSTMLTETSEIVALAEQLACAANTFREWEKETGKTFAETLGEEPLDGKWAKSNCGRKVVPLDARAMDIACGTAEQLAKQQLGEE